LLLLFRHIYYCIVFGFLIFHDEFYGFICGFWNSWLSVFKVDKMLWCKVEAETGKVESEALGFLNLLEF